MGADPVRGIVRALRAQAGLNKKDAERAAEIILAYITKGIKEKQRLTFVDADFLNNLEAYAGPGSKDSIDLRKFKADLQRVFENPGLVDNIVESVRKAGRKDKK
jgi:hypothetical protein